MTAIRNASAFQGTHTDENGTFEVYWVDEGPGRLESESGWYWRTLSPPGFEMSGFPEGPFATSYDAYKSAQDLDFSHNHGGG
jgi:hypothetical protein